MKKLSVVRARQRERTRRSLMDAAIDVFSRHGYERATVDLVAQSAGFSKGAFYVHFDSKEAIFLEVLGEANSSPIGPVRHEPGQVVEDFVERLAGQPNWAALASEFSAHAWRNAKVRSGIQRLWESHERQLELAFVDGGDTQVSARQKAQLLLALFRGLANDPTTSAEDIRRLLHVQLSLMTTTSSEQRRSAA